jgi:hypothetical protein
LKNAGERAWSALIGTERRHAVEEAVKRMRGDGRVYLPKNSTIYMADYWVNGHRVRCSTGCRSEREAWAWLRARQAEIATGNYTGHTIAKIMVSELIKDVLDQHRINGNKSIIDEERHWRLHLKPFFENYRSAQVTPTSSEATSRNGSNN